MERKPEQDKAAARSRMVKKARADVMARYPLTMAYLSLDKLLEGMTEENRHDEI